MGTPQIARLADSDADFERFNVVRNRPAPREDTLRTNGSKGSFEWWYTDAAFEDGTTVVVIFFAKNYFDVSAPHGPLLISRSRIKTASASTCSFKAKRVASSAVQKMRAMCA